MVDFSELKYQLDEWLDQAKDYFSHLTREEQYGWVGEGAGVALFITGIVLLIA